MDNTKDYLMQVKIKNNLLHKKMLEFGHETAASLSGVTGISQGLVGKALNLKKPLYNKWGKLDYVWEKLSDYFGVPATHLLPEDQWLDPILQNTAERELSRNDMVLLASNQKSPEQILIENDADQEMDVVIDDALSSLHPRNRNIVEMHLGMGGDDPKTFNEIADIYNISTGRVNQIFHISMRKMRHPNHSKRLKKFL